MNGIRPLADGVWVTEVPLREYDVRGVLVLGERLAFVWDTLSHPRDMAAWLPLVGDRSLTIAYSHADWDHVWGTAGLPHRQAVIIGHRLCLARFGDDVPRTLDEMRAAEPCSWDAVELSPPNVVFDDELVLDLGSVTVALHHLPGHTRDCLRRVCARTGPADDGRYGGNAVSCRPAGLPSRPVDCRARAMGAGSARADRRAGPRRDRRPRDPPGEHPLPARTPGRAPR